jgi:MYXO-CTERM domain-containing protein
MIPSLPRKSPCRWGLRSSGITTLFALGVASCGADPATGNGAPVTGSVSSPASAATSLAWSRNPPGGLDAKSIPQLVSITFDDNFGLADLSATGGIDDINAFYKDKKNPAGAGNPDNFDNTPIGATFYFTTIYLSDQSRTVLGGKPGEDNMGRNRKAWTTAFQNGHEAADHTINHFNGGVVNLDTDDCCRPRNWSVAQWTAEIKGAKDELISPQYGVGAQASDVIGFRTPFLGYNDNVFTSLTDQGFSYDTTLWNCYDDDEDATKCGWPYTLDQGSPDVDVMIRKFTQFTFPKVNNHPGLWEIPPTTLVVPPDSAAGQYGFAAGLRAKIAGKGQLPYPTIYEASTGKVAGLDYSLLIDCALEPSEMTAILKYNLDQHIGGNRSPLMFIAHSHLYAYSSPDDNPDTPSKAIRDARWKALTDFITYALTKPEVRIVPAAKMLSWVQKAAGVTTGPGDGGTVTPDGGAGGAAADDSGAGTGGATGTGGANAGTGGSTSGTGGAAGVAGSAGTTDSSDGGCSCRVEGTRPLRASGALALLAGLGLLARRRRRA